MATSIGNDSTGATVNARYGDAAIAFHWTAALLVVVVGVLGLLHDSWPKTTQKSWINIHALLGLLLFLLTLIRLRWRVKYPPPKLPDDAGELSRRLSFPVHFLLYFLMLLIPLFGIVTFIWHGRSFNFGLFQVDFHIRSNRAVFHPTEDIHGYLAYALFALAGLHAVAALYHHWIRRDGVLLRMLPTRGVR